MRKRKWWFLAPVLLVVLLLGTAPVALRRLPSRYLVRLPEPIQAWGLPADPTPILPTVARPAAAASLLEEETTPTATAVSDGSPPTITPIPTVTPLTDNGSAATASPTIPPSPTLPPSPTPLPVPPTARLQGITHQFQSWNNCGPATLAMTLSYFDHFVTQSETAAYLKPNPEDRNVSPHEMAAYVNEETPLQALFRANGAKEQLQQFVANDIPVIVEIGIEPPGEFRWLGWYGHYLLVVAYDQNTEQFWVYDSWFGTSEEPLQNAHRDGRALSYEELTTYWPHFNRNYIALYQPEQADTVAQIVGPAMDDDVMWQKALARVRQETSASPNNPFYWFNLGTAYNALGRYDEAATAFDQARAIGLPWRMLWYQFGPYEAYYQVGRYEDILLLAEKTLEDRPYFEESYYYQGLALAATGEPRAARQSLEKAVNLNPRFTPAVEALAEIGD